MKRKTTSARVATSGHIEMLSMLRHRAMTAQDVSDELGWNRTTISAILFRFWRLKILHIAGWSPGKKGSRVAMYRFGEGEDAPYPGPNLPRWMATLDRRKPRSEVISTAIFVRELLHGECSIADLQAATGMASRTVLLALRKSREVNFARISKWERRIGVGGLPTAYWSIGSSANTPRPIPKTDAECRAASRARKTALQAGNLLAVFGASVRA